jgi:hypothetical protein
VDHFRGSGLGARASSAARGSGIWDWGRDLIPPCSGRWKESDALFQARVAAFAAEITRSAGMRAEAGAALAAWQSPSPFDRVDGAYHGPAARRDAAAAHVADVSPRVAAPGLALVNKVVQHHAGPDWSGSRTRTPTPRGRHRVRRTAFL